MTEHGAAGRIVTFYSYKGGTGRTMALANVAWILAASGLRVLAIDWDLEAPGLPRFFHPFLEDDDFTGKAGVQSLVTAFATHVTQRRRNGEAPGAGPAFYEPFTELHRYVVTLDWDFGDGTLDLLPAGLPDRNYGAAAFDWNDFYERLDGAAYLEELRRSMAEAYDYVLIDSRTGLSDVADICTAVLPDTLVNCFTMSDQSINGAAMVAGRIVERRGGQVARILPVPMRLDLSAEHERLNVGRATARAKFDRFLDGLEGDDELDRYWRDVEVPYRAYYSYEEILAVFADPADRPNTVLSSFERLTDRITGGAVTTLARMPDEVRQQQLHEFQRGRPTPVGELYLSYVPEDRAWADWLRELLEHQGFQVKDRPRDAEDVLAATKDSGDRRNLTKTVAVLSGAYLRSDEFEAVRAAAAVLDPAGNRKLVVPISVGGSFANPFRSRATADLEQLSQSGARDAVLGALGGSALPPPSRRKHERASFPGDEPKEWRGVPARSSTFTGRAAILDSLRDALRSGTGAATLLQMLHGLGGVGKTQIALEYTYRFKADYDLVMWVPSEIPNRVVTQIAELAEPLGVRQSDVTEASREVVERLRRGDPYRRALLIFDNVTASRLDDLLPLIPTGGAAHVILTSRDRELASTADMKAIDINVFTREESLGYLQRHVEDGLSSDDAGLLAETLGDLPIALELAAAWLNETGVPFADYLEELRRYPEQMLDAASGSYPGTLAGVWKPTIERLRAESPAAVRLLEVCAFFGPEPISTRIIYSKAFAAALRELGAGLAGEQDATDRLMRDLSRFSLARVDRVARSIQVHRLLRALVQGSMEPDEQERTKRTVRQVLASMRPEEAGVDDPRTWQGFLILWPHLEAAGAETEAGYETRELMIDRVRFLANSGQLTAALRLGEHLRQIWTAQDPTDKWTLLLGFEVANLLRSRGEAHRSLAIDEEVYRLQEATSGLDQLDTLRTAGSIAADLLYLGRWQEALERDRQTYPVLRRIYGEDHPRALQALNNLAVSLRITGKCYEARDLDRKVFDDMRGVQGASHRLTLLTGINLARDLRDCGELAESVDLLSPLVDLCSEALGAEAPQTLHAAKGLAVVERRTGQRRVARARTEELSDRFRSVFGADAPETLACALNLASDELATGEPDAALVRAEGALDRYRDLLVADHPHALVCASNVGVYRRAIGDLAGAERILAETYRGLLGALSPEHPFTLSCAVNLANAWADTGRQDEALDLLVATAQVYERILGASHPDTMICGANRATLLREMGRDDDADAIGGPVLQQMATTYGADDPDLLEIQGGKRPSRELEPHDT
jgi:hypothetical protein